MKYPTTVVGFVAPDGASPTIDGADGRQNRLYLCCRCSGLQLADFVAEVGDREGRVRRKVGAKPLVAVRSGRSVGVDALH